MNSPHRRGEVKNQYRLNSKQDLNRIIEILCNLDLEKPHIVTIKQSQLSKSRQLENYYWGVFLNILSKHTGHNKESLHEFFKCKFITGKNCEVFDEEIILYKTTTKMTLKEHLDFFEQCYNFVVDFFGSELYIPLPNEDLII